MSLCTCVVIAVADMSPGEVGKILGEKWGQLSEKQKAPYEAKAAADKKRYEDQKAAYQKGVSATSIVSRL